VDGSEAIDSEDGIYDIMQRDGGLKFTSESRDPRKNIDEPGIYEEMPVPLKPKLNGKRNLKQSGRIKKPTQRVEVIPQAKFNMKQ
jgi:hypothetical protein